MIFYTFYYILIKDNIAERGDIMATVSFSKDFAITKRETVDRLEKGIKDVKPLNINSKNAVSDMRRREEKLLNILRSKA